MIVHEQQQQQNTVILFTGQF